MQKFRIQLEVGETASPYTEYTGQSYPVTFPAVGENLLPPMASGSKNGVSISVSDDGTITINGTASADTYFDCDFETKWEQGVSINLCAFNPVASESNKLSLFVITNIGNPQVNLNSANAKSIATASANATASRWRLRIPSGVQYTDFVVKPMLQIGGTEPPAYEPYTNTIYGGTLDAVNGVVTVEWAFAEYDGSSDESWNVEDYYNFYIMTPSTWKRNVMADELFCNEAKPVSGQLVTGTTRITATGNLNVNIGSLIGITSVEEFRAWLSTNKLQVAARLATPYEIQLDPITVQTLIGDNTIWTDTNGENTIKYLKKG